MCIGLADMRKPLLVSASDYQTHFYFESKFMLGLSNKWSIGPWCPTTNYIQETIEGSMLDHLVEAEGKLLQWPWENGRSIVNISSYPEIPMVPPYDPSMVPECGLPQRFTNSIVAKKSTINHIGIPRGIEWHGIYWVFKNTCWIMRWNEGIFQHDCSGMSLHCTVASARYNKWFGNDHK